MLKYWVGQKVCSGFPVRCYGKTWMNFLPNPIDCLIHTRHRTKCYIYIYIYIYKISFYPFDNQMK